MRRVLAISAAVVVALACAAPPASAGGPPVKSCPTRSGFMAGPFFVSQLRARVVTCPNARRLAKRWGRTRDCVTPRGGPSDRVCRVGRYRCVTRDVPNFEGGQARCRRRGTRRFVSFRFGS